MYITFANTPRHNKYIKIKIAITPKGPADTGVVIFSIIMIKQRLATLATEMTILNILVNYSIYAYI